MSNDFLDNYKKKVSSTISNIEPVQDLNISTGSRELNLYKKKVRLAGLNPDQTLRNMELQLKSFHDALNNSFDSERVQFVNDPTGINDDTEYLALIEASGDEKFNEDEEEISMDYETSPIQNGMTVDWLRVGFKYLVMEKDHGVKGYFSGKMTRANYLIKWMDENFNVYQQWAVVKGPLQIEAAFKRNGASDTETDVGGNVITIILGKTEATQFLKRYNRIIVKDSDEIDTALQTQTQVRAWRIDVVDDISNKFLVKISLKENYIYKSELTDSEVFALSYNNADHEYYYDTPFTDNMATGYVLNKENISLYRNGQLLTVSPNQFNVYVNDALVNDGYAFNTAGSFYVKITATGYPDNASVGQTLTFAANGATVIYEVTGSDRIKPYKTYLYEHRKIVNGAHVESGGTWSFSNPAFIRSYNIVDAGIEIIAKDKLGTFDLVYSDTGGSHSKTIEVISMLLKQ